MYCICVLYFLFFFYACMIFNIIMQLKKIIIIILKINIKFKNILYPSHNQKYYMEKPSRIFQYLAPQTRWNNFENNFSRSFFKICQRCFAIWRKMFSGWSLKVQQRAKRKYFNRVVHNRLNVCVQEIFKNIIITKYQFIKALTCSYKSNFYISFEGY